MVKLSLRSRLRTLAIAILLAATGLAGPAMASQFQVLTSFFSTARKTNLVVGRDGAVYGLSQGAVAGRDGYDFPNPDEVFRLTPPAAGQTAWSYAAILTLKSETFVTLTSLAMDRSGALYVTTDGGGLYKKGVALKLTPPAGGAEAWASTMLYEFGKPIGSSGRLNEGYDVAVHTVVDGAGNLYGATGLGGANFVGDVFRLSPPPDGKGSWLHTSLVTLASPASYAGSNGLFLAEDGSLYGSSQSGGTLSEGSVWRVTPPASAGGVWTYRTVEAFSGTRDVGARPSALVADRASTLFGANSTSVTDHSFDDVGAIFRLTPNVPGGTKWREDVLYKFSSADFPGGREPTGLVESPTGVLYGTNQYRGSNQFSNYGCGTIFKLTPRDYGGTQLPWNKVDAYTFASQHQTGGCAPTELVKGVSPAGQFALFGVTNSTVFMFVP